VAAAARQGDKVGGAGCVPGGGDARAARAATRAARPAARCKSVMAGDAGGAPRGGRGAQRRQGPRVARLSTWAACLEAKRKGREADGNGLTPGVPTIMIDSAAMAVGGGNAHEEAHVAHAVAGEGFEVDRSTDPEILRQFQHCGSYDAHVDPFEVVDGIMAISDKSPYDACVHNRARAHTRRIHARYDALPDFVGVLAEPRKPYYVGDRVAEVHGDPFFGNQESQRRVYEVMSFCTEEVRYHVPLHP